MSIAMLPKTWNFGDPNPVAPWVIRFGVMAIGLILTGEVVGRMFYGAIGQIPGTTGWHYTLLFYAVLNVAAMGSIVAPKKVGQPAGLIAIFLASLRMMTTYGAAFANITIGLMALSRGQIWGGMAIAMGGIWLIGAVNLLVRLVRQFRPPRPQ
jgi:hypothetical protein